MVLQIGPDFYAGAEADRRRIVMITNRVMPVLAGWTLFTAPVVQAK